MKRIGVLTGGGDCPGLNAVIRAVVKTALNEYGWEILGIEDGFEGLIQPGKVRPMSFSDVQGILPGEQSWEPPIEPTLFNTKLSMMVKSKLSMFQTMLFAIHKFLESTP